MARVARVHEVNIEELKPYKNNAKIHGSEQIEKLKASIEEFGFISPCLIDADYNIIAGHGRVMAAKELGIRTVPCVFIEGLTEEQRRAYILADNRLGELGEWDMDLVQSELADIEASGFDASLTGFDWDGVSKIEAVEDDYDAETDGASVETRVQPGEIWRLGEHRLMCGDSANEADQNALFNGEKAALVFTDPPYGVAIGDKNKTLNEFQKSGRITENIAGDDVPTSELYKELSQAFRLLKTHCEESASYYVTSPPGGDLMFMMLAMAEAGLPVRHVLTWVKGCATFSLGRLDYDYRHEPVLYTWCKSHNFNGGYENTVIDDNQRLEDLSKSELKDLVHALRGDNGSAIYCDSPQSAKLHPTMKPVKLVSRFIYNSSEEGDVVADIFGGSGSTLIACEQLKRRCFIMELDPHYASVIIDRWEQFTGRNAVKIV